jgi:hypothetical protein
MRRLAVPALMHICPSDPRRLYAHAKDILRASWTAAFPAKRRRINFKASTK